MSTGIEDEEPSALNESFRGSFTFDGVDITYFNSCVNCDSCLFIKMALESGEVYFCCRCRKNWRPWVE